MPIKVALIGTGKIAVANHIPGIGFCRDAAVVALSDPNPAALAEASAVTGVTRTYADPFALLKDAPVDAVIVATPNRFHRELVVAAADSGRHVLCEKPLALSVAEANEMVAAAERAGVRHMTAFTYRFVPAMQYMHHLVTSGAIGTPWHFRAQRFQDWDRRAIGWRQRLSEAGSGEIGDMLSHRLDFAHLLVGPMRRVTALTSQIWPTRVDEAGIEHPSDTEDWVGCLAEFASGVTGVFESVKTATGYAGGVTSRDFCEVNGSDGAVIYELSHPLRVLRAGKGRQLFRGSRAARVQEDRRFAPRQRGRRVAGLPVRPGLRVHRGHSRASRLPALVHRRPSCAGSDGGHPDIGHRASCGRPRRACRCLTGWPRELPTPRQRPGPGHIACRGGTWARFRPRRASGLRPWRQCWGPA